MSSRRESKPRSRSLRRNASCVAILPDVVPFGGQRPVREDGIAHGPNNIEPVPCIVARELAARFADGLAVECTHALAGTARPGQTIWIDDAGNVQRIAVHTTEEPEDGDD